MEMLECNPAQSQRDLADKIGISLGYVNSLISRLVKEGHCKVRAVRKSRVKYLLTPKGIAEKSFLTYRYLHFCLSFYKDIQNIFTSIVLELKNKGYDRIAIFGKGQLSDFASAVLMENGLHLVKVVDDIGQLDGFSYDIILLLELDNHAAVEQRLISTGIEKQKILRI